MEDYDYQELLGFNIDRLFHNKRKGHSRKEIIKDWKDLCKYYEKEYLFHLVHNAIRESKVARNRADTSKEVLQLLVPEIHVVYKLFLNGVLVYIGSTSDLYSRTCDHIRDGKEFDKVEIVIIKEEDKLPLEHHMILEYRPPLNKVVYLKEADKWCGDVPEFKQPIEIDRFLVPCTRMDIGCDVRKAKYYMSNGILIPKTFKPHYNKNN